MNSNAAKPEPAEAGSTTGLRLWAGRILTALPILMMTMSAAMKLGRSPQVLESFVGKYGWPEGALAVLAVVEIACVVLYLIPRTAILGAILMTGYLGGAVATHARAQEAFVIPIVLGVFAWGGLYFRDARLRALLPQRRAAGGN